MLKDWHVAIASWNPFLRPQTSALTASKSIFSPSYVRYGTGRLSACVARCRISGNFVGYVLGNTVGLPLRLRLRVGKADG